MTSKLVPPNPADVMVIRKITDNISTLSLPFKRFGYAKIGGRATIVRLQSGALAVFSPVALTPDVQAHLNTLGNNVKYIAATDIEHHIFLGPWARAFPDAKVLAPEGLPEKRAAQGHDEVRFDVVFAAKNFGGGGGAGSAGTGSPAGASNPPGQPVDDEFDAQFDTEFVYAHGNKEVVFNFRPERTLVQADLIFNLPAMEQYSRSAESPHAGLVTRLFNALANTQGSAVWQKRFVWYAAASGDRAGFAASMARIDRWDFERMVPCHGEVVETGAKSVFRKVMAWHLPAAAQN